MEGTIYSLIPAIVMLVLVILTRKVLLSLGSGIVIGALLIHDFNIIKALGEIWAVFYGIFASEDGLEIGNLLLISFLLLLGIMTAFLQTSGGSRAFGQWMLRRVKTRAGAQLMTGVLGLIIFIDDYFNSLAVGQIARPVTDRQRISRAKLAYLIDSTSAPVTVVSPISSWGAYIIGILGGLFAVNSVDMQPLEAFIKMVPMNLYAIASILLVFIVAYFKFDIGPMKKHESRAMEEGELLNPDQGKVPGDLGDVFEPHRDGKVYHLVIPIAVLFLATVSAMLITGVMATDGQATILDAFENTDVNLSLAIGGVLAVLTALLFHVLLPGGKAGLPRIVVEGVKAMLPAIYILILAWMIGAVIDVLETGTYLADLVNNSSINASYLPVIFFVIAGFMALATGSSWGTFGIMLPIAATVMSNTDADLLLPALAAVLAGAVFGDHCSPISDTTILSATGAGANHIDHVLTQLPYALIVALASICGYLVIGLTGSVIISLMVTLAILVATVLIYYFVSNKKQPE